MHFSVRKLANNETMDTALHLDILCVQSKTLFINSFHCYMLRTMSTIFYRNDKAIERTVGSCGTILEEELLYRPGNTVARRLFSRKQVPTEKHSSRGSRRAFGVRYHVNEFPRPSTTITRQKPQSKEMSLLSSLLQIS